MPPLPETGRLAAILIG
jgi:nucleoside-triphosphatase